jgi:2-polyprenyl-3-methyl-5-hydroxy-6-metoxy-1,4-benzoquinol methylase
MKINKLAAEWQELALAWIREACEGLNPTRTGLLDEPMLEACGDVNGLRVLDCGCGEGRFCRLLAARGARSVLGIDLCEAMISAANELKSGFEEYQVSDVQKLDSVEATSLDLVVSYLNQCDLPDYQANNRNVFRVLKPGGRFVIANLHPMRSAVGGWLKNEQGEKLHVILDNYLDEGERHWQIMGSWLTNFHRTLASYLDSYIATGFRLVKLLEPTASDENIRNHPGLEDERRVPNFIIYLLEKPNEN